MKAPLLDLRPQLKSIEAELKAAVNEVIDSTRYVLGPKVDALEESVAALTGVRSAIGVSSGTDALLIALMALEVGPGDIVLTTPYSFFATAGVIARVGARPAFVDIERNTYNIDPSALARWFDEHAGEAGRVKAIIPVHLYGQCADMDPILEIGRSRSIPIVEDAAQAIGAQYPSTAGLRRAGAMGAMGCFSFFPTKNLGAIGEGGMVVTDDEELGTKLKKLRVHGSEPKYYHALIGGNFRIDPIQAAALSVKLPHLERWSAGRREKAKAYDEAFGGGPIQTPHIAYERDHHIYNQYVIAVPGKRDEFRSYLTENEIGSEIYYPVPFHEQECFQYLGYKVGDFPNSEWAARQTVALPIFPEMPDETQQYVIEKIGAYFD